MPLSSRIPLDGVAGRQSRRSDHGTETWRILRRMLLAADDSLFRIRGNEFALDGHTYRFYATGKGDSMEPMGESDFWVDPRSLGSMGRCGGDALIDDAAGSGIGPVVVGFIFHITGSYGLAFLLCLFISVIALTSVIFIKPLRRGLVEKEPMGNFSKNGV